jgi:hypothetical protein
LVDYSRVETASGQDIAVCQDIANSLDNADRIDDIIADFSKAFDLVFSMIGDRLCGLVVRVLGYRSGGPGSIPDITKKK